MSKSKAHIIVIFVCNSPDEGGKRQPVSQGSVVGLCPPIVFDGSPCAVKVWAVKWAPNGLGPVRPMVFFKMHCDIPAGQALSL